MSNVMPIYQVRDLLQRALATDDIIVIKALVQSASEKLDQVVGVAPTGFGACFQTAAQEDTLPTGLTYNATEDVYSYGGQDLPRGTNEAQARQYVKQVLAQYGGHRDLAGETADVAGQGYTVLSQAEQDAIIGRSDVALLMNHDYDMWQWMLSTLNEDLIRQVLMSPPNNMSSMTIRKNINDADASREQGQWNKGN